VERRHGESVGEREGLDVPATRAHDELVRDEVDGDRPVASSFP
jgi:hypothetical protein